MHRTERLTFVYRRPAGSGESDVELEKQLRRSDIRIFPVVLNKGILYIYCLFFGIFPLQMIN